MDGGVILIFSPVLSVLYSPEIDVGIWITSGCFKESVNSIIGFFINIEIGGEIVFEFDFSEIVKMSLGLLEHELKRKRDSTKIKTRNIFLINNTLVFKIYTSLIKIQ